MSHYRYEQESKTQFVVDAVYAFAYALHNLHNDRCNTQSDQTTDTRKHLKSETVWYRKISTDTKSQACPDMANYDGKDFYNNYLLNVSFIDLAGSEVKFDRQGDGLARYDILNYQRLENSSGYQYKVIGKWFNGLQLNSETVVWNKETEQPTSACSLPCEVGMIKKQQGDTCCWICDSCESFEYVYDEFTCKDCGPGLWPYVDKLSCYALDIQYMKWNSLFALIPMAIAIFGIAVTSIVIVLFAKNHDTPLVRASGRELSYTLLFGILVCYCNTFALIAKPTIGSCVLQRFGIGVGFSIIYSALLTKTNRISRIFHSASKSAQRLKYISPQSQVVITTSLIAIQVLITMIWMVVEPPGTRFYYPDRREVILKCKIQDMSFLFSQLYNMILITVCTIYAIKTRKIPENFNESKFIGFTMYTTCIIWLAFVPIYFGTGNSYEVQTTTLCISISLSASVALVCLYSPKVYILVFHPDKNVRKLTMNSTVYRRSAAAVAQGAPTSSGYSRTHAPGTSAPTGVAVGTNASSSTLPTQNSPHLDEASAQTNDVHKSNGEFLPEVGERFEPICHRVNK
ncbi:GM13020 [Drosophila sechellia]|uniref:GM13020 n=1 Tax=Drosophila sechellia TaxID=7238 RepID=B4IKQ0_DROSE|nr:GM13020 [Drosophila sechellia]